MAMEFFSMVGWSMENDYRVRYRRFIRIDDEAKHFIATEFGGTQNELHLDLGMKQIEFYNSQDNAQRIPYKTIIKDQWNAVTQLSENYKKMLADKTTVPGFMHHKAFEIQERKRLQLAERRRERQKRTRGEEHDIVQRAKNILLPPEFTVKYLAEHKNDFPAENHEFQKILHEEVNWIRNLMKSEDAQILMANYESIRNMLNDIKNKISALLKRTEPSFVLIIPIDQAYQKLFAAFENIPHVAKNLYRGNLSLDTKLVEFMTNLAKKHIEILHELAQCIPHKFSEGERLYFEKYRRHISATSIQTNSLIQIYHIPEDQMNREGIFNDIIMLGLCSDVAEMKKMAEQPSEVNTLFVPIPARRSRKAEAVFREAETKAAKVEAAEVEQKIADAVNEIGDDEDELHFHPADDIQPLPGQTFVTTQLTRKEKKTKDMLTDVEKKIMDHFYLAMPSSLDASRQEKVACAQKMRLVHDELIEFMTGLHHILQNEGLTHQFTQWLETIKERIDIGITDAKNQIERYEQEGFVPVFKQNIHSGKFHYDISPTRSGTTDEEEERAGTTDEEEEQIQGSIRKKEALTKEQEEEEKKNIRERTSRHARSNRAWAHVAEEFRRKHKQE